MSEAQPSGRCTQEERRAEAERRLLLAAAELIGEVGPSQVTLAAIGERAGYSRGLATHHFGSKGALMERLVGEVTAWFRGALAEAIAHESPTEQLLGLVRTYFEVIADLPPMHRARLVLMADAVARSSPDVRPAVLATDREFRAEVVAGIERGIASGEVPPSVDPDGLATVVVGMLRGVAFESVLDETIDLDASRAEVEKLLLGRLREAPPVEGATGRRRKQQRQEKKP